MNNQEMQKIYSKFIGRNYEEFGLVPFEKIPNAFIEKFKRKEIEDCFHLMLMGIKENDKDCVRSYYEQLNDLIIEWLGVEE